MGASRVAWAAIATGLGLIVACGLDAVATGGGAALDPPSLDGGGQADAKDSGGSGLSDAPSDAPTDTRADAPGVIPACSDGHVQCAGACVLATDCTGCASGQFLCKALRTCVASCAGCFDLAAAPVTIECIACDPSQQNPIGTCEPPGAAYCLGADYSTAYRGGAGEHCDCNNTEVVNCRGPNQVCNAHTDSIDWCITCGESGLATNGRPCKGGGTCNTSLSPPRCQ